MAPSAYILNNNNRTIFNVNFTGLNYTTPTPPIQNAYSNEAFNTLSSTIFASQSNNTMSPSTIGVISDPTLTATLGDKLGGNPTPPVAQTPYSMLSATTVDDQNAVIKKNSSAAQKFASNTQLQGLTYDEDGLTHMFRDTNNKIPQIMNKNFPSTVLNKPHALVPKNSSIDQLNGKNQVFFYFQDSPYILPCSNKPVAMPLSTLGTQNQGVIFDYTNLTLLADAAGRSEPRDFTGWTANYTRKSYAQQTFETLTPWYDYTSVSQFDQVLNTLPMTYMSTSGPYTDNLFCKSLDITADNYAFVPKTQTGCITFKSWNIYNPGPAIPGVAYWFNGGIPYQYVSTAINFQDMLYETSPPANRNHASTTGLNMCLANCSDADSQLFNGVTPISRVPRNIPNIMFVPTDDSNLKAIPTKATINSSNQLVGGQVPGKFTYTKKNPNTILTENPLMTQTFVFDKLLQIYNVVNNFNPPPTITKRVSIAVGSSLIDDDGVMSSPIMDIHSTTQTFNLISGTNVPVRYSASFDLSDVLNHLDNWYVVNNAGTKYSCGNGLDCIPLSFYLNGTLIPISNIGNFYAHFRIGYLKHRDRRIGCDRNEYHPVCWSGHL